MQLAEGIPLLDALAGKGVGDETQAAKKAKFEASIIATYNVYFPFYEDVVLRRLAASGCEHNVLLVDERHVAEAFAGPTTRPRLAGKAYTLVPVRAPRAFHAKIGLLAGKNHARLFVGSHNATLSGFGLNREVTAQVDISGDGVPAETALGTAIWSFLRGWVEGQRERLPRQLLDAVYLVATRCALLRQPAAAAEDAAIRFLGSNPGGPSLWDQLRPVLPAKPTRVVATAPFFDAEFDLLRTIQDDLTPSEIVIAIEPERVHLNPNAKPPASVRFVDAAGLGPAKSDGGKQGYLHGKALLVESHKSDAVLVLGSANMSGVAWTADASDRNAEGVVVVRGPEALRWAKQLGLDGIPDRPALTKAEWDAITAAIAARVRPPSPQDTHPLVVGEYSNGVLSTTQGMLRSGAITQVVATLIGGGTQELDLEVIDLSTGALRLTLKLEIAADVAFVDIRYVDGRAVRVFAHHSQDILRLSRSQPQRRWRDALEALDSDNPDVATVLRLASQLIFDGAISEDVDKTARVAGGRVKKRQEEDESKPVGKLEIGLQETKQQTRRLKEMRLGDLGYIIDTLIYRLGVGLRSASEQLEKGGRSEEEIINSDDDVAPPDESETDDLLRTCHSKIRMLVTRMVKQLEQASAGTIGPVTAVHQLLAVLAVVLEVRAQDERLATRIGNHTLVPMEVRSELLGGALAHLLRRENSLYDQIVDEYRDDPDDDLPRLRGLLLWLAYDCGLDAFRPKGFAEEIDEFRDRILEKAKVLPVALLAARDQVAVDGAHHAICRTKPASAQADALRWLSQHIRWGREVAAVARSRATPPAVKGTPKPGDLAFHNSGAFRRPLVVLHASGEKASFWAPETDSDEVSFAIRALRFSPQIDVDPQVQLDVDWVRGQ